MAQAKVKPKPAVIDSSADFESWSHQKPGQSHGFQAKLGWNITTHIVLGSGDKTLELWDAVSSAHLNNLKGHSLLICSVTFSPDCTHIVLGSSDNNLRL
jgi:WD40 repeat protein